MYVWHVQKTTYLLGVDRVKIYYNVSLTSVTWWHNEPGTLIKGAPFTGIVDLKKMDLR